MITLHAHLEAKCAKSQPSGGKLFQMARPQKHAHLSTTLGKGEGTENLLPRSRRRKEEEKTQRIALCFKDLSEIEWDFSCSGSAAVREV